MAKPLNLGGVNKAFFSFSPCADTGNSSIEASRVNSSRFIINVSVFGGEYFLSATKITVFPKYCAIVGGFSAFSVVSNTFIVLHGAVLSLCCQRKLGPEGMMCGVLCLKTVVFDAFNINYVYYLLVNRFLCIFAVISFFIHTLTLNQR